MGGGESKPTHGQQRGQQPQSQYGQPQQQYGQPQQQYGQAAPAPPARRTFGQSPTMKIQSRYPGVILDNFTNIQQVQEKLREVGLESSNLIVGIDFTKSNEWTGKHSFQGRSLHATGPVPNPYEKAIAIIGETLAEFDEDNLIPCYCFGDVTTHDTHVFSFYPGNAPCDGFQDLLERYRAIVPHVKLSGPTSFAPIVEAAVRTVEESGGQYHVLVIIADGQVTRSCDLSPDQHSVQEQKTIEAICAASNYPLSIVLVGVGDGPWDLMETFDDDLPQRNFDNFQFVNLTRIFESPGTTDQLAAKFALAALMEVPFQYKACCERNLVGNRVNRLPPSLPKDPPPGCPLPLTSGIPGSATVPNATGSMYASGGIPASQSNRAGPQYPHSAGPSARSADEAANECPVCMQNPKSLVFQCGHQVCGDCGNSPQLKHCPICRQPIKQRIRVYS